MTRRDKLADFEHALSAVAEERTALRLFVAGMTPRSLKAVANLKRLCETLQGERPDVEIIDIYQQPERAVQAQIIAVPTLIKEHPLPVRRLLGSLEDQPAVRRKLGLDRQSRA